MRWPARCSLDVLLLLSVYLFGSKAIYYNNGREICNYDEEESFDIFLSRCGLAKHRLRNASIESNQPPGESIAISPFSLYFRYSDHCTLQNALFSNIPGTYSESSTILLFIPNMSFGTMLSISSIKATFLIPLSLNQTIQSQRITSTYLSA